MSKPAITGTTHPLPFDQLSPRDFERMCFWLVEREGYQNPEHLGAAGSEQGRDIQAWWGGQRVAFQCKRVKSFGPSDVIKEVKKVLALPGIDRPEVLIFIITIDVSVTARDTGRQHSKGQMDIQFWASSELDEKVKKHPDIVAEFFQVSTSGAGEQGVEGYEILFDESHGQGVWYPVKPTLDEQFHAVAQLAGERFKVGYYPDEKQLNREDLSQCRLFILPIGPRGGTMLDRDELSLLHGFVRTPGHCLLVLSTYDGDAHHNANLNELLYNKYGIQFNYDVIMPAGSTKDDAYAQAGHYEVDSRLAFNAYPAGISSPRGAADCRNILLRDVKKIRALSCCSIEIDPQRDAFPLLASEPNCNVYEQVSPSRGFRSDYEDPDQCAAVLIAASKNGRVITCGGWKMFTDSFIADQGYDNKQLFVNILDWVASMS